jgi:hypothetical protein
MPKVCAGLRLYQGPRETFVLRNAPAATPVRFDCFTSAIELVGNYVNNSSTPKAHPNE